MSEQISSVADAAGAAAPVLSEVPEWDLCTRAEAIADGVLVPVSQLLSDAFGFPFPVAVSRSVWADVVAWPEAAARAVARTLIPAAVPCESGRVAVLLHAAAQALAAADGAGSASLVVWRVSPAAPVSRPARVRLRLVLQPGDAGEPVATITAAPAAVAGWCEFTEAIGGRWPVAAFAASGTPLLAPETIDAMLTAGWDQETCEIRSVRQFLDGTATVITGIRAVDLAPDPGGLYDVAPLGWEVRSSPASR